MKNNVKNYLVALILVAASFFSVKELMRDKDFKNLPANEQVRIISQENKISDSLKTVINLTSKGEFDEAEQILFNINRVVEGMDDDVPNKERLVNITKGMDIIVSEYRTFNKFDEGTIGTETYNALDHGKDLSSLTLRWGSVYKDMIKILDNMSNSLKYFPDGHGVKKAARNFIHSLPEDYLRHLRDWKTYCTKALHMDPGRKDVAEFLKLINDVMPRLEKFKHI